MFDDVHPGLIPLTFFYLIIIPIGIFGNFIMILCYFANRRLRSSFHILLTLTCLADLVHMSGQIIFVHQLLTNSFSTQSTCYIINFLPLCGLLISAPLLLEIGLDRLLAVSFPVWYRDAQFGKTQYTLIHLIFPILYSSVILLLGFMSRNEKQVKCAIPTALGDTFATFVFTNHLLYISILLTYFLTSTMLRSHNASSRFKSAFRSIAVTCLLVLFGWAITTLANTFALIFTNDPRILNLIQMYAGITINIACASNLFVFYIINPEYRLTIKLLMDCSINRIPKLMESGILYGENHHEIYLNPLRKVTTSTV